MDSNIKEMEQLIVDLKKEVELKANQPDQASIESIEKMKSEIEDLTSDLKRSK